MAKLWYENDLINKPDCIVHSCINGVPRAIYHFLNPSRRGRMNSSKRKKEAWNGRILLSCNDPSVFNGNSIILRCCESSYTEPSQNALSPIPRITSTIRAIKAIVKKFMSMHGLCVMSFQTQC